MKERRIAPTEEWIRNFLAGLLDAVETIHRVQCYHRDIAPDNILLLDRGGSLLLDFGAARRVIGDMTQGLTVILKPGFAPIEQYADIPGVRQGPWTDVYALAAVVYYLITGKTPPAAVSRVVHDDMVPAREAGKGRYSESFLAAVDRGLAVRPEQRLQNVAELRTALEIDWGSHPRGGHSRGGFGKEEIPRNPPPLFTRPEPPRQAHADTDATRLTRFPDMATRMPATGWEEAQAGHGRTMARTEPYLDSEPFERTAMAPTSMQTDALRTQAAAFDSQRGRGPAPPAGFDPPPPRKPARPMKTAMAGIAAAAVVTGGAWFIADRVMRQDGASPVAVTGTAVDTSAAAAPASPPLAAEADSAPAPASAATTPAFPASPPSASPSQPVQPMASANQPPVSRPPATQSVPERPNASRASSPASQPATVPSPASEPARLMSEDELWRSTLALDRPADYAAYLQRFPRGRYSATAKARLSGAPSAGAAAQVAIRDQDKTGPSAGKSTAEPAQNRQQADEDMWRRMASIGQPEAYESYLAYYPNGRYASEARGRLAARQTGSSGNAARAEDGAAGSGAAPPRTATAQNAQGTQGQQSQQSAQSPAGMPGGTTDNTVAVAVPRAAKPGGDGKDSQAATDSRASEPRPLPPTASVPPQPADTGNPKKTLKMADQTMVGDFTPDFATGIVSGRGRIVWNNGEVFDGTLIKGVKEGQGSFKWKNGQTYTGAWSRDQPNGRGVMVFANGNRYEGEFRDGLPHGQGTTKFKGGDVYTGNWVRGQSHGQGRYTWNNGSFWEGEFRNDQRTENGRMVFSEKALAAARSGGASADAGSPAATSGGGDGSGDDRHSARNEAK
jgi:hypothetical protein